MAEYPAHIQRLEDELADVEYEYDQIKNSRCWIDRTIVLKQHMDALKVLLEIKKEYLDNEGPSP